MSNSNQNNKDPYDDDTICTLCQCIPKNHIIFNACPIMDGFPICVTECCTIGCLKKDIAEKFSKVLGKEITLEQVNKACLDCGKNYAMQNEELAKQMERD